MSDGTAIHRLARVMSACDFLALYEFKRSFLASDHFMVLIVCGVDEHMGARNGSELLQGYFFRFFGTSAASLRLRFLSRVGLGVSQAN